MPLNQAAPAPEQQAPNWKPLAAGAATAAGAYALMRRGGKVGPLNRVVGSPTAPKSWVGKQVDRILYGADNILYRSNARKGIPTKVPGTVLHESDTQGLFRGDRNLGGAENSFARNMTGDKIYESSFIRKHAPEFATDSQAVSKMGTGRGLLDTLAKKRDSFFIKPSYGSASGIGGESFIRPQDIKAYQAGGKGLSSSKRKSIEEMLQNPHDHLFQSDLGIEKGRFSGKNSEVRVHALGGKVVPGATSIRGGNWEDSLRHRQAEEYFQKFLDKAPKDMHRDGTAWAPDIAFTKNGPKIIELNAGGLNSGLLDPRHMVKTHGVGPKGAATAFSAMRNNLAIYKHMTGREHMASAGAKALGYGAAGAGAVGLAQNFNQGQPVGG